MTNEMTQVIARLCLNVCLLTVDSRVRTGVSGWLLLSTSLLHSLQCKHQSAPFPQSPRVLPMEGAPRQAVPPRHTCPLAR